MIPSDLAKISTPAVESLPDLVVPRKDIFLPNSSTKAISTTQAGTEIKEATAI